MAKDRPIRPDDRDVPPSRRLEKVAVGLSVLWIAVAVGALFLFDGGGVSSFAIVMLSTAIVLPLAVIWLFVFALRLTATINGNDARMRGAIDTLRREMAGLRTGELPDAASSADGDALARRLSGIVDTQKRIEAALTRLSGSPQAQNPTPPAERPKPGRPARATTRPAQPAEPPAAQATRALDAAEEPTAPELEMDELISALQFPADAEDVEGFRALRRALQERRTAQLVTAAQDVLTLLSQDSVYMDDLNPEPHPPELWRRFAAGERSDSTAELGAISDETTLTPVAERMQNDMIFRDAVHHFLRLFDHRFSELVGEMSDAEIAAMMETRTGRAFMLLGRAAGTFR